MGLWAGGAAVEDRGGGSLLPALRKGVREGFGDVLASKPRAAVSSDAFELTRERGGPRPRREPLSGLGPWLGEGGSLPCSLHVCLFPPFLLTFLSSPSLPVAS